MSDNFVSFDDFSALKAASLFFKIQISLWYSSKNIKAGSRQITLIFNILVQHNF